MSNDVENGVARVVEAGREHEASMMVDAGLGDNDARMVNKVKKIANEANEASRVESNKVENEDVTPGQAEDEEAMMMQGPGVMWSENFFVNSRGNKIFTQQWVVRDAKAFVVLCHGYADHSHWLVRDMAIKYCHRNISAFAFDLEGHGKSEGLPAFVESFHLLVDDMIQYIENTKSIHPGLKCFLHGGSMGGAIALLVALKRPDLGDGLIVAAPLIKVVETAKPHPIVVEALKVVAHFFPTLPIVPNSNVIDIAYRQEQHRLQARTNPYTYSGKLRLGTGLAILQITEYLQERLHEITKPLLILHGTGDLVTSYHSSVNLFDAARSADKTLKLYEGMWHVLPLEPGAEQIDEHTTKWISERLSGVPISCSSKEFIPHPNAQKFSPRPEREPGSYPHIVVSTPKF